MLAGNRLTQQHSEATEYVRAAMQVIRQVVQEVHPVSEHFHAGRGRPRLVLSCGQLESLIQANFTVPQITHMLAISVSTIRRRMDDYNLAIRATYSNISNEELHQLVLEITNQFPACGSKQMASNLLSCGFRVQQARICQALRRVDPDGVVMRKFMVMHRRSYSVPAPLSLYHIDGNHKLIRYCCMYR